MAPLSSFIAATTYTYSFIRYAVYLLLFSIPSVASMLLFAGVTPYPGKAALMIVFLLLLKLVEYRVGENERSEV